jgi:hypothetical protein
MNLLRPSSAPKMEARGSSETSMPFYQIPWRHMIETSNLQEEIAV